MNTQQRPRIPEIIHRPELINFPLREVFTVIAAIGWVIWLYIISPLFALLAWLFGYNQFTSYVLDDPLHTLETLQIYSYAVLAGGSLFILWGSYNWLRFRTSQRRGLAQIASPGDIGLSFGLTEEQVKFAQQNKSLNFYYNDEGAIIAIEK
ncbi:poly-beta-1,6-N-acetyl-D-glucosamine biosynthesis protein PgaD [Sulfuriferula nivalis]|uniref:Poly-beta-1,6-N-acetyl-D-glucosamine biosynthesis protein PgaD n=1 Tax=Sulfuriferula nivalis TaxID=2675298 RepID=A0A809RNW4_9PROT|nr:poly-beta-1,6-N-acetyl-D-glucosamine biosynthesis protein PgaD [Sulfuriferula nivalis]BBP02474.1 poly-beta-1,6-N-acetyl-D-glucosamine biosynthesis protein PgaD [Sulfuriferula nivalis]